MATKTYVRVRYAYSDEYKLAEVIASYRHASGHVFLIHRDPRDATRYSTTYTPLGFGAGLRSNIEGAIRHIASINAEHMTKALNGHLESMRAGYRAELGSEFGIDHADIWQAVERMRFATGEYKGLPFLDSLAAVGKDNFPEEHFLHLSTTETETDHVAYTPSDSYGRNDRQVRLRFGRYLKKTFPGIADTVVQAASSELKAKLARSVEALHFATDRETMNDIFETKMCASGGSEPSCMYGKWEGDKDRPYHVYADSPDVAVAYLTKDDAILARSVVSTKDKTYIRLYSRGGYENLAGILKDMLKASGYKCGGGLRGNRLTKVGGKMPYLDGDDKSVDDEGKYWVVARDERGEYQCAQTDGTYEYAGDRCETCSRHTDDCVCSYCDCCEEMLIDGCDECRLCTSCDRCHIHTQCLCVRCGVCGDLERDCECEPEEESGTNDETETTASAGTAG